MIIPVLHGVASSVNRAPAFDLVGTMSFSGVATSNLLVQKDKIHNDDFTIEWFQYQTDNNAFPRIFSIGSFPNANIAVSLEGGTFYFWDAGTARAMGSLGEYKNQWVHFAVTRENGTLRTFKNGVLLATLANINTNYSSTEQLRIGNETSTSAGASYGGYLTNFRVVCGTAVYTADFTRPSEPLTVVGDTHLLLLATDEANVSADSSGEGVVVTNNNVTWAEFSDPM